MFIDLSSIACLFSTSGFNFREFPMSFQHENTIIFSRKFKYFFTLILTKFNIQIDTLYYHVEIPMDCHGWCNFSS